MSHLSCRYCGEVFYTDTPTPISETYKDYYEHIGKCFQHYHPNIPTDNSTLAERCTMPSPSQVEAEIVDHVEGGDCKVEIKNTDEVLVAAQLAKLTPADLEIYHSLGNAEQKHTYLDRQKVYGGCTANHQAIGKAWTAYMNNALGLSLPDLKGWQVAHMLTMFKVLRGGKVFHDDNYVDGHNYFEFAHCMQKHNA